jgi:hypothetical protein
MASVRVLARCLPFLFSPQSMRIGTAAVEGHPFGLDLALDERTGSSTTSVL